MDSMEKIDQIIIQLNRIERIAFEVRSPWLTIKEAAAYIKSSDRTLRRWIDTDILKSYKMPEGGRRILRRDIDSITIYGKPYNKLISTQKQKVNELTKDQ